MSTPSQLQSDSIDRSLGQPLQPQPWDAQVSPSRSILWASSTNTASSDNATGTFVSAQAFSDDQGAGGSAVVTIFGRDGSSQSQTAQDFVPGATSSSVTGAVSTTGGRTNGTVIVDVPASGTASDAGSRDAISSNIVVGETRVSNEIPADFDPTAYLAANFDLIQTFGYNLEAATTHYQTYGWAEGRATTFDADDYLASHADLIRAFGYDLAAATRHYVQFGASEGRGLDQFNEVAYLNAYSDLQAAYGQNYALATQHYITYGYAEGRRF